MSELADAGFVDPVAARSTQRKIRLRLALRRAQSSIARILEVLDHGIDPHGDVGAPLIESCVGLAQRDLQRGIGGEAIDLVEGQDMREQELLEGVDLVLQLLDALGVGLQHGLFSVENSTKRMERAAVRHRLSGGAE